MPQQRIGRKLIFLVAFSLQAQTQIDLSQVRIPPAGNPLTGFSVQGVRAAQTDPATPPPFPPATGTQLTPSQASRMQTKPAVAFHLYGTCFGPDDQGRTWNRIWIFYCPLCSSVSMSSDLRLSAAATDPTARLYSWAVNEYRTDCPSPSSGPLNVAWIDAVGIVGGQYADSMLTTGGTPPYTYSIATGSLPPGLSLDPATGIISGTPSTAGSYNVTGQVQDSAGAIATVPFTITVH